MSVLLGIVGVACWLFAGVALFVGFTSGTDIQLIAAAVWGTFGAVCVGSASLIAEVRRLREGDRARNAPHEPVEVRPGPVSRAKEYKGWRPPVG